MALLLAGAASMAMALSFALTWTVRQLARTRGWVNGPISRRHVHTVPIPRLGGIAVFIAIAGVVALLFARTLSRDLLLGTLMPTAWMLAVGLTDDILGLRAHLKLAGQVVGGVGIFCLGLRLPVPGFLDQSGMVAPFCSLLLTVGWTVVVMNAINLVDGLDGLACGSSACIVAAVLAIALLVDEPGTASIAAVAIGVILGFLYFNAYPASIFLGDSGSLVIGAIVAGLTIRLIAEVPTAWLACPLILAHPLAELVISSGRRFLRADPLFRPDRRHLHHRLLDRGLSHAHASAILVLASFLSCLLGVLTTFGGYTALSALILGGATAVLATVELRYGEFAHFFRWMRKIPKEREMIGTQMRLEELRGAVIAARSLTELRIVLSENFSLMGFESARLRVRSYYSGIVAAPISSTSVHLSFPLYGTHDRFGTLDLCWNLRTGRWPFDPEYFTSEFLPVLCRRLEAFVHLYRELPIHDRSRRVPFTEVLPSLVAESSTGSRLPLNS